MNSTDCIRIYDGAFGPTLYLEKEDTIALYNSLQTSPYSDSYISHFLHGVYKDTIYRRNLTVTPDELHFLHTVMKGRGQTTH